MTSFHVSRKIMDTRFFLLKWGASQTIQLVKNLPAMQETLIQSWVRKICWRRDRLTTPVDNARFHQKKKKQQQKKTHAQGQRRSPSKTVGGAKSHLVSNPIPTRDNRRAQTKPHVHQETPPFWVGAAFQCLTVSCEGVGQQCPATGAGALDAAEVSVTYDLLEEEATNPTTEPTETAVNKNKTTSWLWLRSWIPYCQIQT